MKRPLFERHLSISPLHIPGQFEVQMTAIQDQHLPVLRRWERKVDSFQAGNLCPTPCRLRCPSNDRLRSSYQSVFPSQEGLYHLEKHADMD